MEINITTNYIKRGDLIKLLEVKLNELTHFLSLINEEDKKDKDILKNYEKQKNLFDGIKVALETFTEMEENKESENNEETEELLIEYLI